METRKLKLALSAGALALSLALAGCGGGGSSAAPEPSPTPYEMALTTINGADTQDAVRAAYAAVDLTAIDGDEAQKLQAARDARIATLDKMDRAAAQTTALMDAAGMVDTSDLMDADAIADANTAIAGLKAALDAAADVSDADKAMYQTQYDNAVSAVGRAQAALDLAGRRDVQTTDLGTASTMLQDALEALSSPPTQQQIADAKAALGNLNEKLEAAADLTDEEKDDARLAAATATGRIAGAEKDLMAANSDAEDERAKEERRTAAMTTVQGVIMAAETAVGALDENSSDADIMEAEAKVAAIKDAYQAAVADLNSDDISNYAAKMAELTGDIEAAENAMMARIKRDNEMRLENNKVAMRVDTAINAHMPSSTAHLAPMEFRVLTPTLSGPGDTNFGFSRISGDAKFKLTQSASDRKRKPFMPGAAQDAGPGWSGMTFERSGTKAGKPSEEMAAVYTDIKMASAMLWTAAFDNTHIPGLNQINGVVTMTAGNANPVDAMHFTGGVLPNGPTSEDDASTKDIAAGGQVVGSFYGVSGVFSCAAKCAVNRDAKGNVWVTDSNLTFSPSTYDQHTTMAEYANADGNYTHFGYWMESVKQRDGYYKHAIRTFHGGGNATTLSLGDKSTDARIGSAKYYGAAAGVYVKKDGAGDSLVVTNGNFTADAMLTANFGGSRIAEDDQYGVTGTISGFMNGSTDLGFGNLTLEAGMILDNGAITGGETNGGGTSGNWSGMFYGNAGTNPNATTDDVPSDVSGDFTGHFTNGNVAGAFGATKD